MLWTHETITVATFRMANMDIMVWKVKCLNFFVQSKYKIIIIHWCVHHSNWQIIAQSLHSQTPFTRVSQSFCISADFAVSYFFSPSNSWMRGTLYSKKRKTNRREGGGGGGGAVTGWTTKHAYPLLFLIELQWQKQMLQVILERAL